MPSKIILVDEPPAITFEKGMFRVQFTTGNTLAFRPHDFMVAVRQSQTAIEQWFARAQQDVPADLPRRPPIIRAEGEAC